MYGSHVWELWILFYNQYSTTLLNCVEDALIRLPKKPLVMGGYSVAHGYCGVPLWADTVLQKDIRMAHISLFYATFWWPRTFDDSILKLSTDNLYKRLLEI